MSHSLFLPVTKPTEGGGNEGRQQRLLSHGGALTGGEPCHGGAPHLSTAHTQRLT